MSLGPIELLVLRFPGNRFSGEIVPALSDLVAKEMVRIVDIVFVTKTSDGDVGMVELNDLDDSDFQLFDPVVADLTGLLSEEDIQELSSMLDNDSSAALMLFENTWAKEFADAVANSHGEVLLNERIPRAIVDEVLAARAES